MGQAVVRIAVDEVFVDIAGQLGDEGLRQPPEMGQTILQVSSLMASATSAGSTRPRLSTETAVVAKPCGTRRLMLRLTALCSMLEVTMF